jgi:hypothetical protein
MEALLPANPMRRLTRLTIVTERMLLVLTAALVLALHVGGMLAPAWLVKTVPLGEDLQQLLPAAQLILLATWAVLGPGPLWVRLPAAPVLLLLWAVGWTSSTGQDVETTSAFLLITGAAAAVFALGIRCCGIRLATDASPIAETRRHPQFSIRTLIVLTTLVAVTLGVLESLRPMLRTDPELSTYLERLLSARLQSGSLAGIVSATSLRQFVLAVALAVTSLSALWCILRPGAMWLRLMVTAILAPLLGVYLANLTGNGRDVSVNLAIGLTELAAVVGISVLPLRLASVRLMRPAGYGVRRLVAAFRFWDGWRSNANVRLTDNSPKQA